MPRVFPYVQRTGWTSWIIWRQCDMTDSYVMRLTHMRDMTSEIENGAKNSFVMTHELFCHDLCLLNRNGFTNSLIMTHELELYWFETVSRTLLLCRVMPCAAEDHLDHLEALQCVAVCCSVLQCVAVCCSVLQCVAVCCSVCCILMPCAGSSGGTE